MSKRKLQQKLLNAKPKKEPDRPDAIWLLLTVIIIIAIGVLMSNWHLIF